MLKMGILGVGNAGNQVVSYAYENAKMISVFALNCSESDLCTIPEGVPKKLVGDGKGAGKNRDESKKFLAQDVKNVITSEEMTSFITALDVLFIVSSTGGGTGSGISLLLTQIITNVYPQVFVIPVGILPAIKEALSSHANSLEYIKELYDNLDDPTYMIYDNEKAAKLPSNKMMELVNKAIVDDIVVLAGFYNHTTKYASIDDKDLLNLIKTPGRLIVISLREFKEADLDDDTVENLLLISLKNSAHAEIQKDRVVNRIGVIANINAHVSEKFDTSAVKLQETIGSPIENFEHLCINEDRKMPNTIYMILTGCTKINERVYKINRRIAEITDMMNQSTDEDALSEFDGAELNSKRSYSDNKAVHDKVDLGAIFNDFGVKI